MTRTLEIVDFRKADPTTWRPINDGVMGGLSQSRLTATAAGTALFTGNVSLENNGGFASVRADLSCLDLSAYSGLLLRMRGDGHQYRLRLRCEHGFHDVAYQAGFETHAGEWQTIALPFSDFKPSFRGRAVPDAPPLDVGRIRQLGFLIADKQAGAFALELDWIYAVQQ